jgi:hypothetical protein
MNIYTLRVESKSEYLTRILISLSEPSVLTRQKVHVSLNDRVHRFLGMNQQLNGLIYELWAESTQRKGLGFMGEFE